MALIWMDGFRGADTATGTASNFATQRYLVRMYEEANNSWPGTGVELETGWGGIGKCFTFGTGADVDLNFLRKKFTAAETVIVGMSINPGIRSNGNSSAFVKTRILEFMNRADFVTHLTVEICNGRHISVSRSGTTLAVAKNAVVPGSFTYLEIKVKISDTVGTVEIRSNGQSVISLTNQDTSNGGASVKVDAISLVGVATATSVYTEAVYIGDYYICDGTGSVNNDFLGPLIVEEILPDGIGNSSGWTPKTVVDNYTQVDETPLDFDATYVSTTTTVKDTYTMSDLSDVDGTIFGVQIDACPRVDTGSNDLEVLVRRNSVESNSTAVTVDWTNYASVAAAVSGMFETDPSSATAWTIANVNALEAGIETV